MPYITKKYIIGPDDSDRRLDRILRTLCADVPLSGVYRMFRDGAVRVAGKKVDGSYRTKSGDSLEIRLPDGGRPDTPPALPSTVDKDAASAFRRMLLLETPDIAVVNKPRGVLTHGRGGVDEAARAYYADRAGASLAFVPAPLHRLDRNTSGALAVSASLRGAVAFSAALQSGAVRKAYLALLGGDMAAGETWIDELSRDSDSGVSRVDASGKRAEARAEPLLRSGGYTLASIVLGTGRTHQIRAQAASRGYALAGDSKYGGRPLAGGYVLHCASLSLPPLGEGDEARLVRAPLPAGAIAALRAIFGSGAIDGIL